MYPGWNYLGIVKIMRKLVTILSFFLTFCCYAQYVILDKDINSSVDDYKKHLVEIGYTEDTPIVDFSNTKWSLQIFPDAHDSIKYLVLVHVCKSKNEQSTLFERMNKGFISLYGQPTDIEENRNNRIYYFGEYSSNRIILISDIVNKYVSIGFFRKGMDYFKRIEEEKKEIEIKQTIELEKKREENKKNFYDKKSNIEAPDNCDGIIVFNKIRFENNKNGKDYVIINAQEKNIQQIKESVINSVSSMFSHPDKVISTVGDNIIMINGYSSEDFIGYNDNGVFPFSFRYSIKIEIRDGRLKFNCPSISDCTMKDDRISVYTLYSHIDHNYTNQNSVEKIFNNLLKNIALSVNDVTSEDW